MQREFEANIPTITLCIRVNLLKEKKLLSNGQERAGLGGHLGCDLNCHLCVSLFVPPVKLHPLINEIHIPYC